MMTLGVVDLILLLREPQICFAAWILCSCRASHLWLLRQLVPSSNSSIFTAIPIPQLSTGIPPIDPQIRARHIPTRIAQQIHHRAHQILGSPHLPRRNQTRPLPRQIRLIIQDLPRQRRQHIPRTDTIDPDIRVRELDGERRGQMAHGGFGNVVRCLGLRDVDDGTGTSIR